MIRNNKKGSMVVEGSIFIILMIIGMLCLIFLIKACWIQTLTVSSVADSIALYSAGEKELNIYYIKSEIMSAGLKKDNLKKFNTENIAINDINDFEKVSFNYDTELPLPESFVKIINLKNNMLTRKWIGLSFEGVPFGFMEMCEEGEGNEVWLFPRDGVRFHDIDCRYVKSYYEKVSYSSDIEGNYDSCAICIEKTPENGDTVYIFKHGNSYHIGECSAVRKQVICMDRQDALIKGYTQCTVCGG